MRSGTLFSIGSCVDEVPIVAAPYAAAGAGAWAGSSERIVMKTL
jgi:hypothetical protein